MPDDLELREARMAIRYAAACITAHQRQCIQAWINGQESIEQAAGAMGISAIALRQNCYVAFTKMRSRLRELGLTSVHDLLSLRDDPALSVSDAQPALGGYGKKSARKAAP